MGMGIRAGRPRCPDFEERGFCLRGDLCPLEHGANRIVVEDVQVSLKFVHCQHCLWFSSALQIEA
jgi:hypothetical protein